MKIAYAVLEKINHDYVLPSIQREFVWLKNKNEQKIEKLFDSILQEYPFGLVLTWEFHKEDCEKIHYEVYKFAQDYDAENPHNELANTNGYRTLYLVLDGQQRLTALNLGLKGHYIKKKRLQKLYLNLLSDIEDSRDNDYNFKYEFCFFENPPNADNQLWIEVGKVLDFHNKITEDFKEYFDNKIREKTSDGEKIKKAKTILGQLHKRICSDDALLISDFSGDDEKALNVFVRTNDGGVKLEKADLLLSYMQASKKIFLPRGAKKEVFEFVDILNKVDVHKPSYNFSKDDILKAALVISGLEVQYKLKNFNETNLDVISERWESIKKYIALTVKLIAQYGFSSKNIISKNALIPIAYYLFFKNISSDFVASHDERDLEIKNEIIKWLVISQLTKAFGASSDTTLKNMRNSINEGKSFKEINLSKNIDRDEVKKWIERESYNTKYTHLILLLTSNNKYWYACHLDHIYPISGFDDAFYARMGFNEEKIISYNSKANSIVNLHLLNPSVNILKSDNDFVDWKSNQSKEFLDSSLIPSDIDLDFSNFEEFFEKRKVKMIDKVYNALI